METRFKKLAVRDNKAGILMEFDGTKKTSFSYADYTDYSVEELVLIQEGKEDQIEPRSMDGFLDRIAESILYDIKNKTNLGVRAGNEIVSYNEDTEEWEHENTKHYESYLSKHYFTIDRRDLSENMIVPEIFKEYEDFYKRNNLARVNTIEDVFASDVLTENRKNFIADVAYNLRLRIGASVRLFAPISNFLGFKLNDSKFSKITFIAQVDIHSIDGPITKEAIREKLTFKMFSYDPEPARAYTDFSRVSFDLEWFANLTSAQALAVYLHELCHPFFGHKSRQENHEAYTELKQLIMRHEHLRRRQILASDMYSEIITRLRSAGVNLDVSDHSSNKYDPSSESEYSKIYNAFNRKLEFSPDTNLEDYDMDVFNTDSICEEVDLHSTVWLGNYVGLLSAELHNVTGQINFIRHISNIAMDIPINEMIIFIEKDNRERIERNNGKGAVYFDMTSMFQAENLVFNGSEDSMYSNPVLSGCNPGSYSEKLTEYCNRPENIATEVNNYKGGMVNFSSTRVMWLQHFDVDIAETVNTSSTSEEIFSHLYETYRRKNPNSAPGFDFDPGLVNIMGNHSAGSQKMSEDSGITAKRKEDFDHVCRATRDTLHREGIPGAGERVGTFARILGDILDEKSRIDWVSRIQGEFDRFFPARQTYRRLNILQFTLGNIRPTTYGETLKLVLMVDTSGSMANPVSDAVIELENIIRQYDDYEIDFYAVDTDICGHIKFDSQNRFNREVIVEFVKGGGGTDYTTFFKHLLEINNTTPVIVITDMGFDIMEFKQKDIKFPVYWLATENTYDYYIKNMNEYVLDFGEVLPLRRSKA